MIAISAATGFSFPSAEAALSPPSSLPAPPALKIGSIVLAMKARRLESLSNKDAFGCDDSTWSTRTRKGLQMLSNILSRMENCEDKEDM